MKRKELIWLCYDENSEADVYIDMATSQVVFVISGFYMVWVTDCDYKRFIPGFQNEEKRQKKVEIKRIK